MSSQSNVSPAPSNRPSHRSTLRASTSAGRRASFIPASHWLALALLGGLSCAKAEPGIEKDLPDDKTIDSIDSATDTKTTTATSDDGGSTGDDTGNTTADTTDDPGNDDSDVPDLPKFDLDGIPTGTDGNEEVDISYIWISNSEEGTVSKIDTRTMKELGRYRAGPEGRLDPSRTSVNLDADVAVVNREGGVTKIQARSALCTDHNGDGKVTTSTGPTDVLAWGEDDCVLWNQNLNTNSRPAAWTLGTPVVDPSSGKTTFKDPKLWVSAPEGGNNSVRVMLLNGDTGATEKSVVIPNIASSTYGLYGGAVDSTNDLWAIPLAFDIQNLGLASAKLVHVPHDDPSKYETFDIPSNQGYGMTVDHEDRIWIGCDSAVNPGGLLQRYDPKAKKWDKVDLSSIAGSDKFWIRGMMVDAEDDLWAAVVRLPEENGPGGGILRVDTNTMMLKDYIGPQMFMQTPVKQPTGTSIDVEGKVWLVDQQAGLTGGVFVIDPDTYKIDFMGGLNKPYTYSDMTGFALRGVLPPL